VQQNETPHLGVLRVASGLAPTSFLSGHHSKCLFSNRLRHATRLRVAAQVAVELSVGTRIALMASRAGRKSPSKGRNNGRARAGLMQGRHVQAFLRLVGPGGCAASGIGSANEEKGS